MAEKKAEKRKKERDKGIQYMYKKDMHCLIFIRVL